MRVVGNQMPLASCASVGWMPFVGCLALFIPVIGIFICVVLWGVTGIMLLFGGGAFIFSRAMPVNESELAGLMHRYRFMCEGPCPVCHSQIYLMPTGSRSVAQCPKCHVVLHYDSGRVTPG
jgi:hypothetical protein